MLARSLLSLFCAAGLVCALLALPAAAEEMKPNDAVSLEGLKEAKVIFDITQGDPDKLLGRLKLIEKTAKMIADQGVKPEFVLAFRGPASFYVTKDHSKVPKGKMEIAEKIWQQVHKMASVEGVRLEECSVATGFLKIDNKTILPEINVVGNSWISLAGFQNKGYAYIPID